MFSLSCSSVTGKLCLLLLFFGLGCQPEDQPEPQVDPPVTVNVETINASDDAKFLDLLAPLNQKGKSRRMLEEDGYTMVKRVTGESYTNYTLPLPNYKGKSGAFYSMVINKRAGEEPNYALLELIPAEVWSGSVENFTGLIQSYRIIVYEDGGKNQRTVTPNCMCQVWVWDPVEVEPGSLEYTMTGHWETDPDCVPDCSGGSSGGVDYFWTPVWNSGSGGYVENGSMTGSSGGGTSGSGSEPKEEVALISIEEYFAKQLEEALKEDPFLLLEDIPCEELQKWRDLANYEMPDEVVDKLKNLRINNQDVWDELFFFNEWDILTVQEAKGNIVNADFFSVQIDKLPDGTLPEDFVNQIRKDINSFVDTYYSTFEPYEEWPIEESLWLSDNPLGTILSIEMSIFDSGSVICSDYKGTSWKFTTIQNSGDKQHPVSGNREFGLIENNDGTYTFYTMGVDKVTGLLDVLLQTAIGQTFPIYDPFFDNADKLWISLTEKVAKHVNDNGGNAKPVPNKGGRISDFYNKARYILGEVSLDEISNNCK